MKKNPPKKTKAKATQKKLTQGQRDEILVLAQTGMTYTAIAKKMGCSIPNVSYLVKKSKERKEQHERKTKTLEAQQIRTGQREYNLDPIKFRIGKLLEIEADIQFARDEKVIHTLGGLHKLHLSLHEETRTFVEAQKENLGTNAEELCIQIVDAIQGLPPVLKKQVMDELLIDRTNVVRLQQ